MDIVADYFLNRREVNLKVLLQAYYCLNRFQQISGNISQDCVRAAVISSNIPMREDHIEFYCVFIAESSLMTILEAGTISFRLRPELIANEVRFLQGLLILVDKKCGRELMGAKAFNNAVADYLSPAVYAPTWKVKKLHKPKHSHNVHVAPMSAESNDKVAHFLAKVRKHGMDILFPQSLHDKVQIELTASAIWLIDVHRCWPQSSLQLIQQADYLTASSLIPS
jgi:hypothetical protein